jgi:hypothetical protein
MQHLVIISVPFPLIGFTPSHPLPTFVSTVTTHLQNLSAIAAKPNSAATHIAWIEFRTHSDRIQSKNKKSPCLDRVFAEFVETSKQVPQCRSASFQILS